jgi:hypothetical protein
VDEVAAGTQWARLVTDILANGIATYGNADGPKRAFGATSLKTDGRIFAMLVKGRLVVKLPAARVTQLVDDGVGERFDPGHGRVQREWLSVLAEDAGTWRSLADEAESYVARRAL